jgi:antitoxin component of RelBE/YafQ-DinJ toxin-antitoxin module
MERKQQANFRLTPEEQRLLQALAEKLGLSHTAVIRMALRKLAREERIRMPR